MTKIYALPSLVEALELQEKLRLACGYPCCQCHVKPDADCKCTDHTDGQGNVLPGPHEPLTVALEAIDVRENPNAKDEFFACVPSVYEKHIDEKERALFAEKTRESVTKTVALAREVEESPITLEEAK